MNFVLFLKPSQIESRTIHHIFTSRFGRQKFICFVSRTLDSFCLWPLKKKTNFGPLFDREKHFLIQMNKAIKIVSKLLVGQIFAIAFFRLVSDFSWPSQFYAQRHYHFKQIFNKIEHFKWGNCKWKMKCVLPAVLISSQLACKSRGSIDNYLKRNPISKLA